jgi:homoserine dehydrogenase
MKQIRLGIIGFGNVGQGLAQILRDKHREYAEKFGLDFRIVAVADSQKGCLFDPQGLNPVALLEKIARDGSLAGIPGEKKGWDALALIRESGADAIIELSYTDLKTGEPAATHVAEALQQGKHAVITNKGPVALHYSRLEALAREHNVQIGFEGTVMSGTPALRLGRELLAGAGIRRIEGIFNGTTNYILSQMDAGAGYAEALAEAQALGYAEADPSGDVEGFDAAGKVVILARLVLGREISLADVEREGITRLTAADVTEAREAGERWKLVGSLELDGERLKAAVCPRRLPLSHPLAGVNGATNAILYGTDLLGDVTLIGPGAGRLATGYAVIEDLLAIYRG